MAVGTVAAFWAVSILFVLTPGCRLGICDHGRTSESVDRAGGRWVAVGPSAHDVRWVAAGVAALVAQTPIVLTLLTVAGTAYLIWLGVMMLVRHSSPPQAAVAGVPQSWVRQALTGLGISGLNPKVLLLFLALLPQFTDPGASWSLATQIVLLGVVHTVSCAVVYTGVGTGARVVLRTRPAAARVVTWISGVVMIVIGVVLLIERVTG